MISAFTITSISKPGCLSEAETSVGSISSQSQIRFGAKIRLMRQIGGCPLAL
jgi:hypothetical protein